MRKGLFIGLGGSGVATVARLKALLFQRAYGSDKRAMDNDCSFIFYDTDSMSVEQSISDEELRRMMGPYPVIDLGAEFINAGEACPFQMYQAAKHSSNSDEVNQRMLEWAIDPDVPGHFQLSPKRLIEGAGTQRMVGRTGLMYTRNQFEAKIDAGLSKLEAFQGGIWVFASSNGGTSSSALLDVLYMVDRLYKTHVENRNPHLHLVLYMPKAFMDLNKMNVNHYALNAYSTLWELNAFRADAVIDNDGKKFGAFAVRPDREEWRDLLPWQVCSWVLAVDTESNEGRRIPINHMYTNTAETCYFMHTGAVGQTIMNYLDAYFAPGHLPWLYKETQFDPFKWLNFVIGSGYKAINKADDFLKEYVRRRFRYDVYGYGLIGLDFNKILPDEEDRLKAAKAFATKYIMDHLVNIDRFGMSARNSLYGMCEAAFRAIMLPSVGDVPSKDDWFNMGTSFITDCKRVAHELSAAFDDPSSSYSKTSWLSRIEQSVNEGLEKCIVDFGLRYAYSLVSMVDDNYLEREVLGHLEPKDSLHKLHTLECQIEEIIQAHGRPFRPFSRRRAIVELVAMMDEYKKACIEELAINHIRKIIQDLTTGFLEHLRKGDRNHMGIAGLIRIVNGSFGASKASYQDLALSFSKTSSEVCTDYFPRVYEFVEAGEAWKKGNLFEQLYSSIVPVDSNENAEVFDSLSLGCPPLRELGLAPIIREIKKRILNHNFLFSDMVLCHPIIHFPEMFKDLMEQIDVFIEQAINDNTYVVKQWLDEPLESVFDDCFVKDGIIDMAAKQEYCDRFSYSVPVFYPIAQGTMTQVETRLLYVGNSPEFAEQLYTPGNCDEQFVQDASLGHRLMVFKYEIGHNFYDYKYFDMLNRIYEKHREQIEQEAIGCYIHKEFVHRDIGQAFNQVRSK